MQEIKKKGITSAEMMFKIANKHADGQDDVNANMGKYKQRTNEQAGGGLFPQEEGPQCKGKFVGMAENASRSRTIRASLVKS
jgi:hypothetical protein